MGKRIRLVDHVRPFLHYLEDWYEHLPEASLAEVVGDSPQQVALFSIDMINGFCKAGPLASERVGALGEPVVDILQRAHALGVQTLLLAQDSHDPNAPEFAAYPPHCITGTPESETIAEIAALPFAADMQVVPKNSINTFIGTSLEGWLNEHPEISTYIIVGDCSDLCVYSAAMHIRLHANAHNLQRRVIVPAAAVNTYDIPVSVAREAGIKAHAGDLHHVLFLHHMALNGVEVVANL